MTMIKPLCAASRTLPRYIGRHVVFAAMGRTGCAATAGCVLHLRRCTHVYHLEQVDYGSHTRRQCLSCANSTTAEALLTDAESLVLLGGCGLCNVAGG